MSRPVDWSPLADSDPIRGDVGSVQTEASYYSSLAQEISDQVGRLRKIASQGEQVGKTADKLRQAASSSADKIQQTHGRVAAVGEALTSWIPHLETAQSETLSALYAAQDAYQRQQANAAPPAGSPPPKTDAEKTADHARASRLDTANSDLAAAKKKFDDAVNERDRQADNIAGKIKDALHDGLKDGFWDHISSWVSQHVDMIKMVVDVLSWVATGLSIASIFFPVLLPFAAIATGLTLAGHILLAATGNGSWTDVALDAFALATLGFGSVLGAVAKGSRLAAVGESANLDETAARTLVQTGRASEKAILQQATSNVFKRFLTVGGWRAASALKGFDNTTALLADQAGSAARTQALARALPEVNPLESLLAGGKDMAEPVKDLTLLKTAYPDSAEIAQLASKGILLRNANRIGVGVASAVDLTNHVLTKSEIPGVNRVLTGWQPWENWKEHPFGLVAAN